MDAIEVLKTRRSIRRYLAKPVEKEKIEMIINCARLAPTAVNIQPWEFIVITDPEKRKALADATDHGKFIKDAPVAIAVFCDNVKYYLEDGCSATVNLLNAAHALDLGACWVAGDKEPYANTIAEILKVPSRYRLISLISIGYPADSQSGTHNKRSVSEVLHWESF